MRFLRNIWLNLFSAVILTNALHGEAVRFQTGDLVYYIETPAFQSSYPLLVAIEGSYVADSGPTSVLRLHSILYRVRVKSTHFGFRESYFKSTIINRAV